MSEDVMSEAMASLTGVQSTAVSWNDGALLVLAGPGSGKTRILTTRIARLLSENSTKSFRILALTFTTKAADEMGSRIGLLAPGMEKRLYVGTFHGFCMQLLQQHGGHLGLKPDFTIYSQDEDRREILMDGLRRIGRPSADTKALTRYLSTIDKLKGRLIPVAGAGQRFKNKDEGKQLEEVYGAYEAELANLNALDFNSLIHRSFDLLSAMPAIAKQYRTTYRYWLVDEFQDTNLAQYNLLKTMAGPDFKNVFAVADDDQIIYQWNGASYQQIQRFKADFSPEMIQLPTNYRCPASIVQIANRLVAHNRFRTEDKLPLEVGKNTAKVPEEEHLRLLSFENDDDEASGIAADLLSRGKDTWASAAILGRTRAVLEKVNEACHQMSVPAVISQRRDQFVSPEFQLLHAILVLAGHPLDKKSFTNVVSFFNRLFGSTFQSDLLIAEAEGTQEIFMQRLYDAVQLQPVDENGAQLMELALKTAKEPTLYKTYTDEIRKLLASFQTTDAENVDFSEDNAAWKDLSRQINQTLGSTASLDQFLQELSMRSKEPPISPGTVLLMTVHGAKGKEFDYVYVIGLAEEIMPTYFSIKAGEQSAEMEEERRNCFVAVTRTKESLTLSWAKRYKGWAKAQSRFFTEMGLE